MTEEEREAFRASREAYWATRPNSISDYHV